MHKSVKQSLNQYVRCLATPAEIIGNDRPFAGIMLAGVGVGVLISAITASIFCADSTDYARIHALILSIQRGLHLDETTVLPAAEKFDDMLLHIVFREPHVLIMPFTYPIEMLGNADYAVSLSLAPQAAFVGTAELSLSVFGSMRAGQRVPRAREVV